MTILALWGGQVNLNADKKDRGGFFYIKNRSRGTAIHSESIEDTGVL